MSVNISESTSRRNIGGLVSLLGAAAFLAVLDGSAVTASLDALSTSFRTPLEAIVWVTTAYLMACGAVLPLVGWLVARLGGRTTFLIGLVAFLAGSLLTGAAWSLPSLLVFRMLQGLGGGILEPAAIAVAAASAPRERVGWVMGRFSLIINIAPVLGPLLGALLSDHGLWRAIFLVNVPVGAAILLVALRVLPRAEPANTEAARPDLLGIALLAPGFTVGLFALNRWGAGGSAAVAWWSALVAAVLLVSYVLHALRTHRTPVLDLRLLRIPELAAALGVMATVGFTMFTQLTVLPMLAETRYGLHGIARGLLVSALGVGLLVSMVNAGRLSDRFGPRPLVVGGSLVNAAGLALVAVVHCSWPLPALLAVFVVIGLGFGSVASPSFASVYRTLSPEAAAQGTTALFMTVQLFASLGVTVLGAVLGAAARDGYTWTFAVLTVVALAAATLGARLPGRARAAQ
ncbi:MFS transporter [Tsukamurella sp. 8F]|uniref:MFS transporter n=1 Tax=unclassified Tsukamurella TaxID=2633480 RepID=UPI0023B99150|nr:MULTISPECIES: MFS transporter [unclassified Tsukamurella]MDF0529757.1 MFS transporter [Tsukamurella sp. 8J]MDF0586042.1 MFS transporter [Tsukamurella sp. 8F]